MKKFSFWMAALPLGILVLIGASPSFSDFLASQFSKTTDSKVAIKSGASLTNIAFVGTMSGGNFAYTDQASVSFLNQVNATVFNGNLSGDASTADNLSTSANIAFGSIAGPMVTTNAGNLQISYNGGALTNLTLPSWSTNGVASAAVFPTLTNGFYCFSNAAGAIAFTSVSGVDPSLSHDSWGVMMIDPAGSDRTLTLPAAWRVPDGVRTITVTNGVIGVLSVNVYPGPSATKSYTNATYRAYY